MMEESSKAITLRFLFHTQLPRDSTLGFLSKHQMTLTIERKLMLSGLKRYMSSEGKILKR
jgi:hypothetical protein